MKKIQNDRKETLNFLLLASKERKNPFVSPETSDRFALVNLWE